MQMEMGFGVRKPSCSMLTFFLPGRLVRPSRKSVETFSALAMLTRSWLFMDFVRSCRMRLNVPYVRPAALARSA